MATQLPIFKGWTVDIKLRQFRRIKKQGPHFAGVEYVNFDSAKGDALLGQYILSLNPKSAEFQEAASAVL